MSKKKRSAKKRLDSLILILILSTVLMVMSTYAWFTANKTVNIDALDVKVTTSNGLQISADGEDWKSVLTMDDIITALNDTTVSNYVVDMLPQEMAPVSTVGNITNGKFDMFYGNVYADLDADPTDPRYGEYVIDTVYDGSAFGALPETNGRPVSGKYCAIDFWLKTGSPQTDLYMSGSVNEVTKSVVDGKDVFNLATTQSGIAYAARVGLIKGGNTSDTEVDAVRALSTATNSQGVIWEPNYDGHTKNGIANANSLAESTGWFAKGSISNGTGPVTYDGILAGFNQSKLLGDATQAKDAAHFGRVTPTFLSTVAQTKPNFTFPANFKSNGYALEAGATKYRLYLWVEGQDIDCENYAAGTYLEYNISFSLDSFN